MKFRALTVVYLSILFTCRAVLGAELEVPEAFEAYPANSNEAVELFKKCMPSVSEASYRQMVADAGEKNTISKQLGDKTKPYFVVSAGRAFCVKMSDRKYPLLPLLAFDETIGFPDMPAEEVRRLRTDLSRQLAMKGFATALVVDGSGNAYQVVYLLTSDAPTKISYHANFLKKGEFAESAFPTVYKTPNNMSMTSRGGEKQKPLFALPWIRPKLEPELPKLIGETRGNFTNVRIEGSLAATRDLDCLELAQVKNTYTPPDLHTAITKCFAQAKFNNAAQLLALAGVYSRYDAERVADRTAQGGVQVLIMRTFAAFSQDQKEKFSQATNLVLTDPKSIRDLCAAVQTLGPPDYFPKYLILHGMGAYMSATPLENALTPNFDSAGTWARLQDKYLHCPK
ncbi:MAG: hypothetical protein V4488_26600 [Pseudomonadota bacterium]